MFQYEMLHKDRQHYQLFWCTIKVFVVGFTAVITVAMKFIIVLLLCLACMVGIMADSM